MVRAIFYSRYLFVCTTFGLTEIHGQILGLFDHRFQHLARYQFDTIFRFLRDQPLQNLFLFI